MPRLDPRSIVLFALVALSQFALNSAVFAQSPGEFSPSLATDPRNQPRFQRQSHSDDFGPGRFRKTPPGIGGDHGGIELSQNSRQRRRRLGFRFDQCAAKKIQTANAGARSSIVGRADRRRPRDRAGGAAALPARCRAIGVRRCGTPAGAGIRSRTPAAARR